MAQPHHVAYDRPDNRTRHPEREKHEEEKPDDPVPVDLAVVALRIGVHLLGPASERFKIEQPVPAHDKERIKQQHQGRFDVDVEEDIGKEAQIGSKPDAEPDKTPQDGIAHHDTGERAVIVGKEEPDQDEKRDIADDQRHP